MPFTQHQINQFVMDIIRGLDFLQGFNILHRNLSPDNIFVLFDEEENIQKLALGNLETADIITKVHVSIFFSHFFFRFLKSFRNIIGEVFSPFEIINLIFLKGFRAPEVMEAARGGNEDAIGFPSDIFSLGIVLYTLMTLDFPSSDEELPTLPDICRKRFAESVQLFESLYFSYHPLLTIHSRECTKERPEERPNLTLIRESILRGAKIDDLKKLDTFNIGVSFPLVLPFSSNLGYCFCQARRQIF